MKYFPAENVFNFQLFLHSKLFFYKHSVLLGQPQYAHDFSRLSLMLCLQNMLKFSPWSHSKSTYVLKEGDGTPKAELSQKRTKAHKGVRGEGAGVYVNMTNLEHTNDPLPKAVGFIYFYENPFKMMNVSYFI